MMGASLARLRGIPGLPVAGIFGPAATVIYLLFIGLPVLALLIRAAQHGNFLTGLVSDLALTALRLSLITSGISMGIILLVGTPFSYLLARNNSWILRIVDSLIELPIVLPPVVAGVAMLMAFGRQGVLGPVLETLGISLPFTTGAVVFAQIFVAAPFYIRSAKLGFNRWLAITRISLKPWGYRPGERSGG